VTPHESAPPKATEKHAAILEQLQCLLDKGVAEQVHNIQSPGFYSQFFVIPKKELGSWRFILDLTNLNRYMAVESFKVETTEHIREVPTQGEWVTSLDFSDAYHHIPIHLSSRKFLRFCLHGRVYQFI
jgi:hypothetical protein